MGREVRRVRFGYEHPRDEDGSFIPMNDGWPYGYPLSAWQADWREQDELWRAGDHPDQIDDADGAAAKCATFADWDGDTVMRTEAHMPELTPEERAVAGWCYYENTTEGTPLSPVFATASELAEWMIREADGWRDELLTEALRYVEFHAAPSRNVYPGWWKHLDRCKGDR